MASKADIDAAVRAAEGHEPEDTTEVTLDVTATVDATPTRTTYTLDNADIWSLVVEGKFVAKLKTGVEVELILGSKAKKALARGAMAAKLGKWA